MTQIPAAMRATPDWWSVLRVYALGSDARSTQIHLRNGGTIVLETRDEVAAFWQIFAAGCYDVHAEDRVIIDAGANIGLFALWAAQVAPKAHITSVEPHPGSCARMQATMKANRIDRRVELIQTALGPDSEPQWLIDAEDGASTAAAIDTQNRTGGNRTQVPCMTLSALLKRCETPEVDLLKMDIEASEYETLLATPKEALRRIRRINVEMHVPGDISAVRRKKTLVYLKECGFAIGRYESDENGNGIAFFERV
jgi:FkbM family methyltransferase